jgi:putative membrane protein
MDASEQEEISMLMTWTGPHAGPWFLALPFLWITVVALLVVAFRGGWGRRGRSHEGSAEAILGERFAKGDITAEEYRGRLAELRRK